MKKVLFFLFSILILYSCDDGETVVVRDEMLPYTSVKEFKYKNHSYLRFSRNGDMEVIHDPDCKYCYNKFD